MASMSGAQAARRMSATGSFFSLFYDWSMSFTGKPSSAAASFRCPVNELKRRFTRPSFSGPNLSAQQGSARARNKICSRPACSRPRHASNVPAQEIQDAAAQQSSTQKEPELSSHLRTLMRGMPHSVVVATSSAPTADQGGGSPATTQYRGMTVSSFTTLTLTPIPIVTFNIRKPSTTLDAIRASGTFFVHILSATVSGARVADAFTKGNGAEVWRSGEFTVLRRAKGTMEPPLLAANGITRVLRCKVLEEPKGLLDVGDHVLVLGKVLGILVPPGSEDRDSALCYADREYKQLGDAISIRKENP